MVTFLLTSRRAWKWAAAALLAVPLWYLTALPRGMAVAYFDHRRADHEILYCGWCCTFPPDDPEYLALLLSRYGVRERRTGWGAFKTMYARGYNRVSRRLLNERHGRDIFAECRQLASENRVVPVEYDLLL